MAAAKRQRTGTRTRAEPTPVLVDDELLQLFIDAHARARCLKLTLRAERASTGEDFMRLPRGRLAEAAAAALDGVVAAACAATDACAAPRMRQTDVRVRMVPCAFVGGVAQVAYYTLEVACPTCVAVETLEGLIRAQGGLLMDLGRRAPARAVLYEGRFASHDYVVHVTSDDAHAHALPARAVALFMRNLGFTVRWVASVEPWAEDGRATVGETFPEMSAAPDLGWLAKRRLDTRSFMALVSGGHDGMRALAGGGALPVANASSSQQAPRTLLRGARMPLAVPPAEPTAPPAPGSWAARLAGAGSPLVAAKGHRLDSR